MSTIRSKNGTDIKFVTMLEVLNEAVRKFHSAVPFDSASLNANDDSTRLGSSKKWLDYLQSLASAAETTADAMELAKKHLYSLITTLGTSSNVAVEKISLPCHEA